MTKKYSLTSRILHWSMAAVIIFLLGLGIFMTDFLSKEAPNRMEIYNLHKSLGVLILILISLRIVNRLIYKAPPLLESLPKIEKNLAHLAHLALYFLMILVPLSGYFMSNFFGYPVNFFGIEMPFLVEKNFITGKVFAEIHEVSAFTLLGLVALHILAVIKHRFFDKPENDVLKRMI
jgi:cytochrome b561